MFCDKCGTPFVAGAQYCTACGKPIVAGAAPAAAANPVAGYRPAPASAVGDGRVGRNVSLLAGLWAANGVLRLMEVGWLVIFRRFFFDWGWPFGSWGLHSLLSVGLFSGGMFLAAFGVIHLLLAWGLFERQPWARVLGIVVGILALVRFPFGTALGIYTLWVLAPEGSGREWETMSGVRTPVAIAR